MEIILNKGQNTNYNHEKSNRFGKTLLLMIFLQTIHTNSGLSVGNDVNFASDTVGLYDKDQFKVDWNTSEPSSQSSHFMINTDPQNTNQKVLNVTCLANQVGGGAGMAFIGPLGGQADYLNLQYDITFPENIDFGKGGKMPGLTSEPDSPSGCIDNDSFDGFSARFMWRADEAPAGQALLQGYIYNPEKIEDCGDYYSSNPPYYIEGGQSYTILQQVYLGDPGISNGYILAWANGTPFLNISNIMLRRSPDIHVDAIHMSLFYGGSDAEEWAPKTDQHIALTNFTVSSPTENDMKSNPLDVATTQYLRKRQSA